jgi:hypothetical protein
MTGKPSASAGVAMPTAAIAAMRAIFVLLIMGLSPGISTAKHNARRRCPEDSGASGLDNNQTVEQFIHAPRIILARNAAWVHKPIFCACPLSGQRRDANL